MTPRAIGGGPRKVGPAKSLAYRALGEASAQGLKVGAGGTTNGRGARKLVGEQRALVDVSDV